MRLRRFRGTILVGTLIAAAFIADGLAGGPPPGDDSEGDAGALSRDAEGSTSGATGHSPGLLNRLGLGGHLTSGAGRGSPRKAEGSETAGSRMGGGSRLGGNSVHGLDTGGGGGGGGSSSGLDPAKPSIF